jgi:hypothetical protein
MTPKYADILKHTVGADSLLPGTRNRYVAVIGSDKHADCQALEDMGFMEAGLSINGGKDQYFFATRAGCEAIGLSKAATNRALAD